MNLSSKIGSSIIAAIPLFFLTAVSPGRAQTPPDLITFNFTGTQTNLLPGTSKTPGPPCNGTIAAADQIGNLALVALFFQNDCYTDGRFNNNNYVVDRGTVAASGGGASFEAYRVHEPQNKATQFLASRHAIYYRFPTIENYTVYSFAGGSLSKVAEVPASAIPNTTDFTPISTANPLTVSDIVGSTIFVFAPSSARVSSFTLLAPGVEGARVAATAFGNVLKYRYTVAGMPFDSAIDFSAGPGDFGNTYSATRRFFLARNGSSGLGAVWQDQTNSALKLTWFGADRISPTTVALANPQAELLACAAGDDTGNVYFLTVQPGSGAPNTPRTATLTKAGPTGATIATTALDTSATGLNIVQFSGWVASMKYLNGKVAVMIGRTMLQSPDGLNHQGGIALVFNGTTLALDKNWGQTSGHSWENVLTSNTNGQFVGIDMGDNFPRGINLHKFTDTIKNSRVISSYKTAHGTTPQSPDGTTYPVYTEISTNGITYYRWSNDNRTYTELGGLAQTPLGYTACFVGERSPAGRLLDNGRVGGELNDPRNIGFITVIENFQNASGGGVEVSDDLVVTSGLVETSGYYGFTGGWTPQRNAGVVWLSNYSTTSQNASRLKMTPRADGSLLFLWEIWTSSAYVATKGMTVAENGTIINAETDLSSQVRLGRRDDPYRLDNGIYLVAGHKADTALELIVIEPGNLTTPSAVTLAATGVTGTAATLNGSANPNGSTAIGFFQWGTTTGYGQTTPAVGLGNGTASVPLSAALSGLTAGQTYHFRAAASNSFGVVFGGDMNFTTVASAPPNITGHPQPQTVTVGGAANFNVTATGTAPLAYQWRFNQANLNDGGGISGAQTSALTLQNVQLAQAGNYDVVVTNSLGRQTSNPALLTVNTNTPLTLASSLNAPTLVWTTSGTANWYPQTTNTHDGVAAAQSGAITNDQNSILQTTVTGPGTLTFWWQASSEFSYDLLTFAVDGANQFTNTGITPWSQITLPIAAGTHTLTWTYQKDFSLSDGSDAGWVDEVTFTSSVVPRPTLGAALTGSNLKITWPNTATNFNLQFTTNLANPAWQVIPSTQISNEPGQFYYNVRPTNSGRIFRLSTP